MISLCGSTTTIGMCHSIQKGPQFILCRAIDKRYIDQYIFFLFPNENHMLQVLIRSKGPQFGASKCVSTIYVLVVK